MNTFSTKNTWHVLHWRPGGESVIFKKNTAEHAKAKKLQVQTRRMAKRKREVCEGSQRSQRRQRTEYRKLISSEVSVPGFFRSRLFPFDDNFSVLDSLRVNCSKWEPDSVLVNRISSFKETLKYLAAHHDGLFSTRERRN